MASKTSIANLTLTHLGAKLIADIEENSDAARTLNAIYDNVLDGTLRQHPWNFAVKRAILASTDPDPAHTWDKGYQPPSDFLRMISTEFQSPFSVEGGRILSNEADALNITYIARITDTAKFDALFVEAFALKLAVSSVERITQSNAKKNQLDADLALVMQRARNVDGQEDDKKEFRVDPWIRARR